MALLLGLSFASAQRSVLHAEGEDGEWGGETVSYAAVNPYYGGWSNCTWGAWQLAYSHLGIHLPQWGMAGNWVNGAKRTGYNTGNYPKVGSIAVYSGHVAYVAGVSADGSRVYIKEGGFLGGYHERWVSRWGTGSQSLRGYIYLNE